MNLFPSRGTPNVVFNQTNYAQVKDRFDRTSYNVQDLSDRIEYQDVSRRRLGWIDKKTQTTYDHAGHILARNARPDLILMQKR